MGLKTGISCSILNTEYFLLPQFFINTYGIIGEEVKM